MDFKVDFGVIQSIIPDVEAITAVVADYISKNPIKETDPTVAE